MNGAGYQAARWQVARDDHHKCQSKPSSGQAYCHIDRCPATSREKRHRDMTQRASQPDSVAGPDRLLTTPVLTQPRLKAMAGPVGFELCCQPGIPCF